jgi:hypothetical protein
MKPMSKKIQMICALPAVIIGGAVMIYCFATNMPGNKSLIFGIAVMAGIWLLMYLFVGKKMQAQEAEQEEKKSAPAPAVRVHINTPSASAPAKAPADDTLNLQSLLTPEELKILLSDLQVAADHAPSELKAVFPSLTAEISRTGTLKAEKLPLCVSAVEIGLGVFSAFGIAPAGHSNLLDKLKKLAEEH